MASATSAGANGSQKMREVRFRVHKRQSGWRLTCYKTSERSTEIMKKGLLVLPLKKFTSGTGTHFWGFNIPKNEPKTKTLSIQCAWDVDMLKQTVEQLGAELFLLIDLSTVKPYEYGRYSLNYGEFVVTTADKVGDALASINEYQQQQTMLKTTMKNTFPDYTKNTDFVLVYDGTIERRVWSHNTDVETNITHHKIPQNMMAVHFDFLKLADGGTCCQILMCDVMKLAGGPLCVVPSGSTCFAVLIATPPWSRKETHIARGQKAGQQQTLCIRVREVFVDEKNALACAEQVHQEGAMPIVLDTSKMSTTSPVWTLATNSEVNLSPVHKTWTLDDITAHCANKKNALDAPVAPVALDAPVSLQVID